MKLGKILYEADYDTYLAREVDKHNGGNTKVTTSDATYNVDLVILNDDDEIDNAPESIEINVDGIDSWNTNPRARHEDDEEIEYNYDNAEATLSKNGMKELKAWLKKNNLVQTDIDFDISFENEDGSVTVYVKEDKK